MKVARHALCVLMVIASLACPPAVRATSFSTDQSDVWWTVGESGWGMQLVQRGSVIFATLYVYGPSTGPTFYTATLQSAGNFVWTGALQASTGPWFGTVPFNPGEVTRTTVGTMTWQATDVDDGTLTYVVNGLTVVKNMTRLELALDDFSGHYAGGEHIEITGCSNSALNGTSEVPGVAYITQTGSAITIQTSFVDGACTYSGTLTEAGQMGSVQGSFACTDGANGTFTIGEMQVNLYGITAAFTASSSNPPGCQSTGWFGGVFGTTF